MRLRRHQIPFECRPLGRKAGSAVGAPSRETPGNPAETFGTRINMYATE